MSVQIPDCPSLRKWCSGDPEHEHLLNYYHFVHILKVWGNLVDGVIKDTLTIIKIRIRTSLVAQ